MRDDRWLTGDAYDVYMGRWSRLVARAFVEWLQPKRSANWLEVGCGTGALTSTICDLCEPASVTACDLRSDKLQLISYMGDALIRP